MRSLFIVIGFIFSSSLAMAHLSAIRGTSESYETARERHRWNASLWSDIAQASEDSVTRKVSAERAKVELGHLNTSIIPEMPSYQAMQSEFEYVRDSRFLKTFDPKFPRRLTWLYPDDGCYARAEFSKRKLIEHEAIAPMKIFVFGNLYATTKNTMGGFVTWWYHVAVTYRVGDDVYVFDASIDPSGPMTLAEWNQAVGGNQTAVKYSVCSAHTYDPDSDCNTSKEVPLTTLSAVQNSFLRPEWNRVKDLNRDPQRELGESPPWLN